MNETVLISLTGISFVSTAAIWLIAWRMNCQWAAFSQKLLDENERMNNSWAEFYEKIMEVPRNGKD